MEIKLGVKPKSPTIIEGFPGLGLIGTITTEYLIKHLNAKPIGHIKLDEASPILAIHNGKIIQPLEIYYAKSKNILILHSLLDPQGNEWEITEAVAALYKQVKAKEVISLEGIMGQKKMLGAGSLTLYGYSTDKTNLRKLKKAGATELKEGILMGVTAALILNGKGMKTTGIFVETNSKMPDSRAAAKIIEALDGYMGLKVDFKPLEKAAADFEKQLQDYVSQMEKTTKQVEKKNQKSPKSIKPVRRTYFG